MRQNSTPELSRLYYIALAFVRSLHEARENNREARLREMASWSEQSALHREVLLGATVAFDEWWMLHHHD